MSNASSVFEARRQTTELRLRTFSEELKASLGRDRQRLMAETCVYVTGSAARGELSTHSDLDVFVLRAAASLSRLDEIELKAAIIRALRASQFPAPSRDGEFLAVHLLQDLLGSLGTPSDDARNLFTARMLLLLESRCVEGTAVYQHAINKVIDGYWRDHSEHRQDYLPIVLLNDVSRYWRIVLLNYESRRNSPVKPKRETEAIKASRRLQSHKLRFSRCLLCYSAVSFMLAEASHGNVSRDRIQHMVGMSPIERFRHVAKVDQSVAGHVQSLLENYADFLRRVDARETTLVRRFSADDFRRKSMTAARNFGEQMFELVQLLGRQNPLYRYLVV